MVEFNHILQDHFTSTGAIFIFRFPSTSQAALEHPRNFTVFCYGQVMVSLTHILQDYFTGRDEIFRSQVPVKQAWGICVNTTDHIHGELVTHAQENDERKTCAYFMGYILFCAYKYHRGKTIPGSSYFTNHNGNSYTNKTKISHPQVKQIQCTQHNKTYIRRDSKLVRCSGVPK